MSTRKFTRRGQMYRNVITFRKHYSTYSYEVISIFDQWFLKYLRPQITVCTVVQNCCKGDSPCQWNIPIFRPPEIENPWTDRH